MKTFPTYLALDFTHTNVGLGHHLWAIRLRYRPGILGQVVAHDDGWFRDEERGWDWEPQPLRIMAERN